MLVKGVAVVLAEDRADMGGGLIGQGWFKWAARTTRWAPFLGGISYRGPALGDKVLSWTSRRGRSNHDHHQVPGLRQPGHRRCGLGRRLQRTSTAAHCTGRGADVPATHRDHYRHYHHHDVNSTDDHAGPGPADGLRGARACCTTTGADPVCPYPSYSGGTNYTPSYSSSGAAADADFLFRMRARQIVTPGDAQEVYGAHIVCQGLDDGNSLTTQANALQQAPYNYRASLAGYFAGEAVKVYCPQFSYLLKP